MPDEAKTQQPKPPETVLTEKAPVENDSEKAPDPNAELAAKMDAFQKTWDTQIAELKQTVGRAQSVADKASQREPNADLQKQLTGTQEVLDTLVSSLDPDALPPEVRTRIVAARAALTQEASRQAMRTEIVEELREELKPAQAPNQAAPASSALEARLVQDIRAAGLNPDDPMFNWADYAQDLRKDSVVGAVDVALKVAAVITENASKEDDAARDKAKENASSAPAGGSVTPPSDDLSAVLNDPLLDLDAKKAALMAAIR